MSRTKRQSDIDLDDESDTRMSSSASSSHSSSGRKRRRISPESDTTPEQDPTRNIYNDVSDDYDSESTSTEQAAAATQSLNDRLARAGETRNAEEAGTLLRVEVHDFMCHHYHKFSFGPRINFICGNNGSGKSALLTAIIICLGGKASTTDRGNSLKTFIKNGRDQARIICTLRNKGEGAYMPDEFGDEIVVERTIRLKGSSGFVIRTAGKRVFSSKRKDLDDILDYFALQIDNPLNVLTQDRAREFLGGSKPQEKYKFFIKGVQLQQLDEDYHVIEDQLANIVPKLARKREDIDVLKRKEEDAAEIRETAKKRDGLKDKLKDVRRQLIWRQVQDQEEEVQQRVEDIEAQQRKIASAERKLSELDTAYQNADAAHEVSKAAVSAAEAALELAKQEKGELDAAYQEAKKEYADVKDESTNVKNALIEHTKNIEREQQKINDEEIRLLEANGGGAARRLRELEDAKIAAELAKQIHRAHQDSKDKLDTALRDAGMLESQRGTERDECQGAVKERRARLEQLKASKHSQSTNAFRRNTDKLIQAIDRESGWTHKPIGPVGNHVRLKKPEWSSILETYFGQSLSAFITFSKRDSDLLGRLMRQVGCDAHSFITNRNPLVPREPDEQFTTVLRALDIDDEFVQKHLIVNHAIEQQLLINDVDDATSAMYDGGRLRNVKGCLAMNPHDQQKGIMLKYGSSGTASQDPISEWRGVPRMKGDIEATIALAEQKLHDAQDKGKEAQAVFTDARVAKEKASRALAHHAKKEKDLRLASQAADDAVENLQDLISDDNVDNGKLDQLRSNLHEEQDKKNLAEQQFKDVYAAEIAKKEEMRKREGLQNDFNKDLDRAQKNVDEATVAYQGSDRIKQFKLGEKHNASARVEDFRKALASAERAKIEEDERLAEFTEQARGICERVNIPAGATRDSLQQTWDRLKADEKWYAQRLGFTLEQATNAHRDARNVYKEAKKDLDSQEEMEHLLRASLAERKIIWRKFRGHISVRAKTMFSILLGRRNFSGKLWLDHKQHALDITVEPDNTKQNSKGRGAKTLSGGEKSYSQICLLLAMWEAMGSPLRCLDEFDVFMDAVNRKLSVGMIIEAARESSGKQYILISPGSTADIPEAPDVYARSMGEAQREGQRTLQETGVIET